MPARPARPSIFEVSTLSCRAPPAQFRSTLGVTFLLCRARDISNKYRYNHFSAIQLMNGQDNGGECPLRMWVSSSVNQYTGCCCCFFSLVVRFNFYELSFKIKPLRPLVLVRRDSSDRLVVDDLDRLRRGGSVALASSSSRRRVVVANRTGTKSVVGPWRYQSCRVVNDDDNDNVVVRHEGLVRRRPFFARGRRGLQVRTRSLSAFCSTPV